MRACHPATACAANRVLRVEVTTPRPPAFTGGMGTLTSAGPNRNRVQRRALVVGLRRPSYKMVGYPRDV